MYSETFIQGAPAKNSRLLLRPLCGDRFLTKKELKPAHEYEAKSSKLKLSDWTYNGGLEALLQNNLYRSSLEALPQSSVIVVVVVIIIIITSVAYLPPPPPSRY